MAIGGGGLSVWRRSAKPLIFLFDAARVATMSTGDNALLQDFVEEGLMERRLAARGNCDGGWEFGADAPHIVGWRVSRTIHASFVLDALEQALYNRLPASKGGLVHH